MCRRPSPIRCPPIFDVDTTNSSYCTCSKDTIFGRNPSLANTPFDSHEIPLAPSNVQLEFPRSGLHIELVVKLFPHKNQPSDVSTFFPSVCDVLQHCFITSFLLKSSLNGKQSNFSISLQTHPLLFQPVNVLQELCNTMGNTQTLLWYIMRTQHLSTKISCHLDSNCFLSTALRKKQ